MLKNFIVVTVRNLYRHKFYAGLNILGLSVGLASCLLIFLFVNDELSFDRFHKRASQIYRVNWDYKWNDNEGVGSGTPPPLAKTMQLEIPEVRATTRIYTVPDMVVRYEDKFFNETEIFAVDPNFFDLFTFKLLEGNPATALSQPGSVILTRETAQKYFGEAPALGRTIRIGKDGEFQGNHYSSTFQVTGIVEEPPHNSHFDFDILTSMSSHPHVAFFDWSWVWMQVITYAMVDRSAAVDAVEAKMVGMVATHAPKAFARIGLSFEDLVSKGGHWKFVLQPLTDIYLGSANIGNRLGPLGNKTNLALFSVIALFILLIACINFMNLATARSSGRVKEVGVRKVLGSVRRNLIGQFMVEAMLFSFLAMIIAIGLVEAALPPFEQLSGKALNLDLLQPAWLPAALVLLTLGVALLVGSYPSVYLAAFHPIEALRGKLNTGRQSQRLRNGLVVLQFAISITLIISTLLVHAQLQFFQEADIGFKKEGLVVISNQDHRLGTEAGTFTQLAKNITGIEGAAVSTGVPPDYGFQDFYKIEGRETEQYDLISYMVDNDFISTLGLDVVQGRGFSKAFGTNADAVLLNESAVKQFGWQNPLGKKLRYGSEREYEVIGVIKDFNHMALYQPIMPFALFHTASKSYTIPNSYIVVRTQLDDLAGTLARLEEAWLALAPGQPFETSFLDDNLAQAYASEERLGTTFVTFSALAILIACLGLLGLAAFTAEKRTKEVGIRKTLGASVSNVVILLTKEFTKWVLVANCLAWPLAWFAMERWLQNFAYRIDIGYRPFLIAAASAFAIALLTVGYQAVKAAVANPVEALKYE